MAKGLPLLVGKHMVLLIREAETERSGILVLSRVEDEVAAPSYHIHILFCKTRQKVSAICIG